MFVVAGALRCDERVAMGGRGADDLVCRREVLPVLPLVVEHVGGDPEEEERHEDQGGREEIEDVLRLHVEVHEVPDDQRRLDHRDPEGGQEGDDLNLEERASHADGEEDEQDHPDPDVVLLAVLVGVIIVAGLGR